MVKRYFCHTCNRFFHVSDPTSTCTNCQSACIEEVETAEQGGELESLQRARQPTAHPPAQVPSVQPQVVSFSLRVVDPHSNVHAVITNGPPSFFQLLQRELAYTRQQSGQVVSEPNDILHALFLQAQNHGVQHCPTPAVICDSLERIDCKDSSPCVICQDEMGKIKRSCTPMLSRVPRRVHIAVAFQNEHLSGVP